MVARTDSDFYTPFQHPSMVEEGPQSSEDGSGLHSPVFGAQFPRPHGNDFRYHDQVDIQDAAGILAAHFDYPSSLIVQQPPLIDTTLETPSPSAQHVSFPSNYSIAGRNQLETEFVPQSSVNSRLSHPAQGGEVIDFPYNSPERRSSGRQSHDPSIIRTSGRIPMDGEHGTVSSVQRAESSAALTSTRPRDRKEISTVVIACRQCRSRKIRCDSTRPTCDNCRRRSNICEYDTAPKRRGPDKRPGTRQRSCKKRPADGSTPPPPKRKKTARATDSSPSLPSRPKENMPEEKDTSPLPRQVDRVQDNVPVLYVPPTTLRISTDDILIKNDPDRRHSSSGYEYVPYKSSYPRPLDMNVVRPSVKMVHEKFPTPSSPKIESNQREWWSQFTTNYSINDIVENINYLFSDTGHWLSFLNLEYLVQTVKHPEDRHNVQPAFVLSSLAMATLMKSSQAEYGVQGRSEALVLRDHAQAALESALNSEWVDATLAEAALILTLFETSVHPQYNPDRISTSLAFLDNIIRSLGLTTIDASDPDVCLYPRGNAPVVNVSGPDDLDRKCTCIPVDAAHPPDLHTSWSYPPPWDSSWTEIQIRDEECRRLCWCAVGLVANYFAQCVVFDRKCPDLFLSDSSNFQLLFPGEVVDRVSLTYRSADSHSPKESVWALYCRSMLLWNYSNRLLAESGTIPDEDKAEYAHESWSETQAIQDSIDMHICNLDTALIYLTREYIYNTRINVTQVFRRSVPSANDSRILNRRQALDWIYYQDQVIKRVKLGIQEITDPRGHQLTRRPFQAIWFSNQLSICLTLYHKDRSLLAALDLAKSIVVPIDVMNALWPCSLQQRHCEILREQLIEACASAGLDPPLAPEYSIPPALRLL